MTGDNGLIVIQTVGFGPNLVRRPNLSYRGREHLTPNEMSQLIEAARGRGRHGHRDATMVHLAYRHGLRVNELVNITWDQLDLESRMFHVQRLKGSDSMSQPLGLTLTLALRRIKREQPIGRFVFTNERGSSMTAAGFARLLSRAAESIEFPLKIHPHMLRHACGYKMANDGQPTQVIQQWLGHRQIQHTLRYARLCPEVFDGLWEE